MEQLEPIPALRCRSMFGGFGLYAGDQFFGIIYEHRLYFRTTEETRRDYIDASMTIFRPNDKQSLKNYYEVPPDVLEDKEDFVTWARKAINSAK